jgi:hypothetical protein
MNTSSFPPTSLSHSEPLPFSLPGILPEQTMLYLDPVSRALLLLQQPAHASSPLLHTHQLSPTVLTALRMLFHTYPSPCSSEALIQACFSTVPLSDSAHLLPAARPLRHIMLAFQRTLPPFGMQIYSIRNHGYLLVPLSIPFSPGKEPYAISAPRYRTQQTGAFGGKRIVQFGNIIAKNWVQERPQSPCDLLYLVIDGVFMKCLFQALTQYEVIA